MTRTASVLIPAHNEADFVGACLSALLQSTALPEGWDAEIIVIANGCTDDTVDCARSLGDAARADGWQFDVLDLPEGGKLNALNRGEAQARGDVLIYLDADVIVTPGLIPALVAVLAGNAPRYASGTPSVAPAHSWVTAGYGRFWSGLPFMTSGVPGFGVFAMNRAGRARWDVWPDIISDDTLARLQFAPNERVRVEAGYSWPMVEGFANLVRVRRRQDVGVQEIATQFPQLMTNDDKPDLPKSNLLEMLLRDPIGFVTYGAVSLAVKTPLFRGPDRWARGR